MLMPGMCWEPNRRITDSEWKVWEQVARGAGNPEIASDLDYTVTHVSHLLASLYDKLRVPDGSARRVKLALMFPRRE